MPLTDAQIDRYSRQIIVPRIGGRAQERILAARIVIAAEDRDLEPALAYLAGAGVGRVYLGCAYANIDIDGLAAAMHSLNPDCAVTAYAPDDSSGAPDLLFAIIGGRASQSTAQAICKRLVRIPAIIARLDSPARIGIFPAPPPCANCSDALLSRPLGERSPDAAMAAVAATAEAIKLLAGYDAAPRAALIEFDGYQSRAHEAVASLNCGCSGASR
ncbi:MAG: hypothetical protein ACYDC3_00590 [Candidatus Binataceae bacterium]